MSFADRRDAGRRLAAVAGRLGAERPVVVAVPRGGVPVAVEVARALDAPLDVLAVRKLGAPDQPEYGVGAVAEGGIAVLDGAAARATGLVGDKLDEALERESRELERRVAVYRAGRAPVAVDGRTVIVVDDGLATGLSDLAAVRALRARGAARVVVAVPVASAGGAAEVRREADELLCVAIPPDFRAVGLWYADFAPVTDGEVVALLARAWADEPAAARATAGPTAGAVERALSLAVGPVTLRGDLTVPPTARGLVIFAHGTGSGRRSARNRAVAGTLREAGFATLLFDLLDEREARRRDRVFDVETLAGRLQAVVGWAREEPALRALPIGLFGASTGAAAALRTAAALPGAVSAVVSRGGRPDLAADQLPAVVAPTLLVVGSADPEVLELNRRAAERLGGRHELQVVPGAGHLFEEPGALEALARLATDWFTACLPVPGPATAPAAG
jgi:putative phosphoribosyl transferase